MEAILDIKDEDFEKEVIQFKEKVILVDFWAPWCMPCKMQSGILDKVHEEIGTKVKIIRMNVDDNTTIPLKYKISSIPTLLIFKNGKQEKSFVGVQSKESLVDELLKLQ